jgi:UDP:flavonoid glycosyltransferase YjiC (YdhE family)
METKKILFASIPADGHFSPMTGMAMELKNQGHDVRWYTSRMFEEKLKKLGIPHYPFEKALEVNQFTVNEVFPERKKIKAGVPQLKFDLKHFFIYRSPEYFEDICEIKQSFPFDVFVCDAAFTAGKLVKEKLKVPSVAVGIIPVMSTSKDLPPYGLGLTPDHSFGGRIKQKMLRFVAKNILFKESSAEYNKILKRYDLPAEKIVIFDIPAQRSDVFLQSGTPGFEYERGDMPEKLKFVGPLHAFKNGTRRI